MKLDYDVLRGVMLKIEEEYVDVALYNLKVNDYDLKTIAYHCKILYEGGYVDDYGGNYGDGELIGFGVGSLTFEGHQYLDKIREDGTWNKTKRFIAENKLPVAIDVIKQVSSTIVMTAINVAIKAAI